MKLDLKLFARARDLAGSERLRIELSENACVADLRAALGRDVPMLRPLIPSLLIAVGSEYANDLTPLRPGMEVACFPPVSGG